jgi:hypothetical protein
MFHVRRKTILQLPFQLGAVAKFRKAIVSFIMSVCQSVGLSVWKAHLQLDIIFTNVEI